MVSIPIQADASSAMQTVNEVIATFRRLEQVMAQASNAKGPDLSKYTADLQKMQAALDRMRSVPASPAGQLVSRIEAMHGGKPMQPLPFIQAAAAAQIPDISAEDRAKRLSTISQNLLADTQFAPPPRRAIPLPPRPQTPEEEEGSLLEQGAARKTEQPAPPLAPAPREKAQPTASMAPPEMPKLAPRPADVPEPAAEMRLGASPKQKTFEDLLRVLKDTGQEKTPVSEVGPGSKDRTLIKRDLPLLQKNFEAETAKGGEMPGIVGALRKKLASIGEDPNSADVVRYYQHRDTLFGNDDGAAGRLKAHAERMDAKLFEGSKLAPPELPETMPGDPDAPKPREPSKINWRPEPQTLYGPEEPRYKPRQPINDWLRNYDELAEPKIEEPAPPPLPPAPVRMENPWGGKRADELDNSAGRPRTEMASEPEGAGKLHTPMPADGVVLPPEAEQKDKPAKPSGSRDEAPGLGPKIMGSTGRHSLEEVAAGFRKVIESGKKLSEFDFKAHGLEEMKDTLLQIEEGFQRLTRLSGGGGASIRQMVGPGGGFADWMGKHSDSFDDQGTAEQHRHYVLTQATKGTGITLPPLPPPSVQAQAPQQPAGPTIAQRLLSGFTGGIPGGPNGPHAPGGGGGGGGPPPGMLGSGGGGGGGGSALGTMMGGARFGVGFNVMQRVAGAVTGGIETGYTQARQENIDTSHLSKVLGDVGTDFEALRGAVRTTADGLHLAFSDVQRMSLDWAKENGGRNSGAVQEGVGTAAGFSKGYGLDEGQTNRTFARASFLGQDPKKFAMLIAESARAGGIRGQEGELTQTLAAFRETMSRQFVDSPAAMENYARMFSRMSGDGRDSGRGPQGRDNAEILKGANDALSRGGAMGEASQALSWTVMGEAGINNVYDAKRIQERGMMADLGNGQTFGEATHAKLMQQTQGMAANQRLDIYRNHMLGPGYSMDAAERLMGAMGSMGAERAGGREGGFGSLTRRLEAAGIDGQRVQVRPEHIADLDKIERQDATQLEATRQKMLARPDAEMSREQRDLLRTAPTGDVEETRSRMMRVANERGIDRDMGQRSQENTNDLSNKLTELGQMLQKPAEDIKEGAIKLAEGADVFSRAAARLYESSPDPSVMGRAAGVAIHNGGVAVGNAVQEAGRGILQGGGLIDGPRTSGPTPQATPEQQQRAVEGANRRGRWVPTEPLPPETIAPGPQAPAQQDPARRQHSALDPLATPASFQMDAGPQTYVAKDGAPAQTMPAAGAPAEKMPAPAEPPEKMDAGPGKAATIDVPETDQEDADAGPPKLYAPAVDLPDAVPDAPAAPRATDSRGDWPTVVDRPDAPEPLSGPGDRPEAVKTMARHNAPDIAPQELPDGTLPKLAVEPLPAMPSAPEAPRPGWSDPREVSPAAGPAHGPTTIDARPDAISQPASHLAPLATAQAEGPGQAAAAQAPATTATTAAAPAPQAGTAPASVALPADKFGPAADAPASKHEPAAQAEKLPVRPAAPADAGGIVMGDKAPAAAALGQDDTIRAPLTADELVTTISGPGGGAGKAGGAGAAATAAPGGEGGAGGAGAVGAAGKAGADGAPAAGQPVAGTMSQNPASPDAVKRDMPGAPLLVDGTPDPSGLVAQAGAQPNPTTGPVRQPAAGQQAFGQSSDSGPRSQESRSNPPIIGRGDPAAPESIAAAVRAADGAAGAPGTAGAGGNASGGAAGEGGAAGAAAEVIANTIQVAAGAAGAAGEGGAAGSSGAGGAAAETIAETARGQTDPAQAQATSMPGAVPETAQAADAAVPSNPQVSIPAAAGDVMAQPSQADGQSSENGSNPPVSIQDVTTPTRSLTDHIEGREAGSVPATSPAAPQAGTSAPAAPVSGPTAARSQGGNKQGAPAQGASGAPPAAGVSPHPTINATPITDGLADPVALGMDRAPRSTSKYEHRVSGPGGGSGGGGGGGGSSGSSSSSSPPSGQQAQPGTAPQPAQAPAEQVQQQTIQPPPGQQASEAGGAGNNPNAPAPGGDVDAAMAAGQMRVTQAATNEAGEPINARGENNEQATARSRQERTSGGAFTAPAPASAGIMSAMGPGGFGGRNGGGTGTIQPFQPTAAAGNAVRRAGDNSIAQQRARAETMAGPMVEQNRNRVAAALRLQESFGGGQPREIMAPDPEQRGAPGATAGNAPGTITGNAPAAGGRGEPGGAMPQQPGDGTLGGLSARFESGGRGAAAIGRDSTGGASYGTYQLAAGRGSMAPFLRNLAQSNPEMAARLEAAGGDVGARAGTPEFKAAWRELAQQPAFAAAQHDHIKQSHYDPAARSAETMGINLQDRTPALRDVIWSTAVQHGPGSLNGRNGPTGAASVMQDAVRSLGATTPEQVAKLSDSQISEAIYEQRRTRFGRSTPDERASVMNRFDHEGRLAQQAIATQTAAEPRQMATPPAAAQPTLASAAAAGAAGAGGQAGAPGAPGGPGGDGATATAMAAPAPVMAPPGATPAAGDVMAVPPSAPAAPDIMAPVGANATVDATPVAGGMASPPANMEPSPAAAGGGTPLPANERGREQSAAAAAAAQRVQVASSVQISPLRVEHINGATGDTTATEYLPITQVAPTSALQASA